MAEGGLRRHERAQDSASSFCSDLERKGTPSMRKHIFVLALVILAVVPATAQAHGRWYNTAARTEQDIEYKYRAVAAALCKPLPVWARGQYRADSYVRGTVRVWNHFLCAVYSTYSRTNCLSVAHLVGQHRDGINLTSWKYGGRGCTTRDLWG